MQTKLEVSSEAIFSCKPKPNVKTQQSNNSSRLLSFNRKTKSPFPPAPEISKYGRDGFLLESMTVKELKPTKNTIGLEVIFNAYSSWQPTKDSNFNNHLLPYCNSDRTIKPSPSLANVLTTPLNFAIAQLSINADLHFFLVEKIQKLLQGEQIGLFGIENSLSFADLAILKQVAKVYDAIEPLIDQNIRDGINLCRQGQYMYPAIRPEKSPNPKPGYVGYSYPSLTIQQAFTGIPSDLRGNETLRQLGISAGYGYYRQEAHDSKEANSKLAIPKYGSILLDWPRGAVIQNKLYGEWRQAFQTTKNVPSDDKKYDFLAFVLQYILKQASVDPINTRPPSLAQPDSIPSESLGGEAMVKLEDEIPQTEFTDADIRLARVHAEILNRIYNQDVSNLPQRLFMTMQSCFGLGLIDSSLSEIQANEKGRADIRNAIKANFRINDIEFKAQANECGAALLYDSIQCCWYCDRAYNKVITPQRDPDLPRALYKYTCRSTFVMPKIDMTTLGSFSGNAAQYVDKILSNSKGFEIESDHANKSAV